MHDNLYESYREEVFMKKQSLLFFLALAFGALRYALAAQSCPGPKFQGDGMDPVYGVIDYCDSLNRSDDTVSFLFQLIYDVNPYTTNNPEEHALLRKWTDSLFSKYYLRNGGTVGYTGNGRLVQAPTERMTPPPDSELTYASIPLVTSKADLLSIAQEGFVKTVYLSAPGALPIRPHLLSPHSRQKPDIWVDAKGRILRPRGANTPTPARPLRLYPISN